MTRLLVNLFVKNNEDIKNAKVRQNYGMLSGTVGIMCNLILFILKFFAGTITGAVSIAADAFNNLSDAGSSVVTLLGFKMAGKPADPDHPFGHGRIEYIAGFIVSVAIMIMGVELFKMSVVKIVHPEDMGFSILSVVILVGSIGMKMWMAAFNKSLSKKIDSAAMNATAMDSLSDCVATTVVLISLIVATTTGINIDGIAGVFVAIFVFKAGVDTAKDTLQPLLGQPAKKEFVEELESIVMSHQEIIGIHDLIVHDYGPGRVFASLHAEIPYNMDILEAHDIIDMTEYQVQMKMGCGISIHMDPVVTDDVNVLAWKQKTLDILHCIDQVITMHDFRITNGPDHKNLIFDIVVPFGYKLSDDELKIKISEEIAANYDRCYPVINVDRSYIK